MEDTDLLIGYVIKIHSDFYYVKVDSDVIECKLREILKKEDLAPYVGDRVRLVDYRKESNQAAIAEILPRKNYIPRPSIANIDQVIIVTTLKNPVVDPVQLNRYIIQAEIYGIPVIICVNKSDLIDNQAEADEVKSIYEPLGYKVIFTSALKNTGIDELKAVLESKISVLCGSSGVGKSSILNAIEPGLRLKTHNISKKTARGTHTTRHTEIIEIKLSKDKTAQVADTPGFSYLRFDNILPEELDKYFPDIYEYSKDCHFHNCLHLEEIGCNVLENLENIESSRYESYKEFLDEAKEYKETLQHAGHKEETKYKTIDSQDERKKKIIKLGTKSREKSRKNQKQKLNTILTLNDAYYNSDEDT